MSYNPESMKVTSGRDSNYKSGDVKARPANDPKSRKDFKEVLEKTSENDEEENGAAKEIIEESNGMVMPIEEVTKKGPISLFDLTSGKSTVDPIISKSSSPDNLESKKSIIESPSAIYSKMTSGDTKKGIEENLFEQPINEKNIDKNKFTTRFSTEQTDLSYINPLAATTPNQPSVNLNISTEKAIIPVSNIQEIITQMIEKVTEMKKSGTTETVLTLKNPPLFEGATIIITAFDNAKNEFNITIENLTQAGKHLMDQQGNKDSLLLALEQKGYTVHILTTTTLAENRPVVPLEKQEQTGRERGNEREGKQQRGKEDET